MAAFEPNDDLGNVHEVMAAISRILLDCEEGRIERAHDRARAIKEHIIATPDLDNRVWLKEQLRDAFAALGLCVASGRTGAEGAA